MRFEIGHLLYTYIVVTLSSVVRFAKLWRCIASIQFQERSINFKTVVGDGLTDTIDGPI